MNVRPTPPEGRVDELEPDGLFPIVGIGASAGGLAATTELLRHLGPRPGIGAVIVHHLDPTHESSLVEIFARATPLPVHLVSQASRVEPNHVYVVPPNAGLSLVGGVLNLTPRIEEGGLHLPIDRFFESLAEDRRAHAVGVLLSGNGSDGSFGMNAIKAAGGVTLAQDASAEYRSMPESAIARGCVDLVLSPGDIGRELSRMGERPPPDVPLDAPKEGEEPAFQRLLLLLREASHIDFANYKHATIRRRAQRRVFLHHLRDLREYVALLERDPAEITALSEDVLIHVTGFFRDPNTFDALVARVFPKLLEQRPPGMPIRIWVPGCSTGEEVYSLAISLLEFLAGVDSADTPIKLFGTDVSAHAIERARSGKYAERISEEVSPGRLTRFFSKHGGMYQIRKDVRDACVFARHDATRDPPFSGMDIISCRNLMIYLGSALQDRAVSIFHYALKEPGFLVLGSSETIHAFPGFSAFDAKNKIYQRTSAAPRLLFDFTSPELAGAEPQLGSSAGKASGPQDVHREADRLVLAKFAPPGMVVTDDLAIVQFRGKTAPYLQPAPGTPSFDLLRMVREELRLPLRRVIDQARTTQGAARKAGLRLHSHDGDENPRVVDIDVLPFAVGSREPRFFVVLFQEVTPPATEALALEEAPPESAASGEVPLIAQLRQELASTREYLESVIEQLEASNEELKAANEEITSSNEELRSTNEELQMAKEEIQATNEELRTVNDEMNVRNAEATRLSDDLTNVLSSVEIPIVLLGRDAKIRRFAPAAARVLELAASDIGRPLFDVHRRLALASAEIAAEVLARLTPVERTLQDEGGHWYQLTARPYLTLDSRIDGTVLAAFDIDPIKKATEHLAEVQRQRSLEALQQKESDFRDVLTTAAEGILMVDATGHIIFANRSVAELFGYEARELLTQSVALLVPERLRERHAEQGAKYLQAPSARRLGGEHALMGRRKDGTEVCVEVTLSPLTRESGHAVVCFVSDVTARREADRRIADYQEKLRQMAFDAALAEERERRRIAADLHDRIGQSLALSQMKLESLPKTAGERTAVDEAIDLLTQSIADTRTLIFDLSPPILYELGLEDALSWLAEDLGKRWGIRIEVSDDKADKPLGEATAALVFRAVRELLTNVIKHAHTNSANVSLRRAGDRMEIDVEDRGIGFNTADAAPASAGGGFGLFSLREQISRLGGTVELASVENRGTRVSLRVPLQLEPSPGARTAP